MYNLQKIIKRNWKSWNFQRGGCGRLWKLGAPATSRDAQPISAAPGVDAIWEQPWNAMETHDDTWCKEHMKNRRKNKRREKVKLICWHCWHCWRMLNLQIFIPGLCDSFIILYLWTVATQLLRQGLQALSDSPKVTPPAKAANILAALWSWPVICDAYVMW